jgi:hypothetical protein
MQVLRVVEGKVRTRKVVKTGSRQNAPRNFKWRAKHVIRGQTKKRLYGNFGWFKLNTDLCITVSFWKMRIQSDALVLLRI